jgi:hypothetical protein
MVTRIGPLKKTKRLATIASAGWQCPDDASRGAGRRPMIDRGDRMWPSKRGKAV